MPRKIKVPEKADRILKLLKFAVLLFVIIGVWTFSVTGTTLWSPWTIFGMYATFKGFPAASYLLSIGGLLMLLILIGSFFIERFFCKYLCPLGALYSLAAKLRIFKIKKPTAACGNCCGLHHFYIISIKISLMKYVCKIKVPQRDSPCGVLFLTVLL